MIRIGIIDDEKHARDAMRAMLSRIDEDITIVFEVADVESAIESISSNTIDLLFLDIHLQTGNGFHILERLPERPFEVVFVTAYNQYAIDAFQFAALNYILKPVKLSDVRESISRVKSRRYPIPSKDQLQVVPNNFGVEDIKQKKITLPCGNEFVIINISRIIRLEANGNYTWFIIDNNEKYLVCRTMKEYENLLCKNGFFRIHQSHIVNLDQVTKFHKSDGGEVIMSDGSNVPIGRNRKDEFLKLFRT
jgi:two-component system, LytTR family, response regulator